MTKPISRKMAVDCLLYRMQNQENVRSIRPADQVGYVRYLICTICDDVLLPGQQIQFDHIHADVMGGPHEYQNLRPVHYDPCHKRKSKKDVGANAKVKRILGETGQNRPSVKIKSRGFQKGASRPLGKRNP